MARWMKEIAWRNLKPSFLLALRERVAKESKGTQNAEMPICFNSKSRIHSEFSNFFPFVSHNTLVTNQDKLRHIEVALDLPQKDQKDGTDETASPLVCNSVEAAYQLGKYLLFVDDVFAKNVLLPMVREGATAPAMKSAGSQTNYIRWASGKAKGGRGLSKVEAKAMYDAKQGPFRQSNMEIMLRLLWSKFTRNPVLKKCLLESKAVQLHEGGRPSVWTRSGGDALGKLLQHVRSHLRRGTSDITVVVTDSPLHTTTSPAIGQKRSRSASR